MSSYRRFRYCSAQTIELPAGEYYVGVKTQEDATGLLQHDGHPDGEDSVMWAMFFSEGTAWPSTPRPEDPPPLRWTLPSTSSATTFYVYLTGCEVAGGVAPTCSDGVRNGDEGDVDCGGTLTGCATRCANLASCLHHSDCESALCSAGVCTEHCSNTDIDGDETDADCGGRACPKCSVGSACRDNSDCESGLCSGLVCIDPFPAPPAGEPDYRCFSTGAEYSPEYDLTVANDGAFSAYQFYPTDIAANYIRFNTSVANRPVRVTAVRINIYYLEDHGGEVCLGLYQRFGDVLSAVDAPQCSSVANILTAQGTNLESYGRYTEVPLPELRIPLATPRVLEPGEYAISLKLRSASGPRVWVAGYGLDGMAARYSAWGTVTDTDPLDPVWGPSVSAPDSVFMTWIEGCEQPAEETPSCSNGMLDGLETGIDCGRHCPGQGCGDGYLCLTDSDCKGGTCPAGTCESHCNNAVLDGDETAADCGGGCAPCGEGLACIVNEDCSSGVCASGVCAAEGSLQTCVTSIADFDSGMDLYNVSNTKEWYGSPPSGIYSSEQHAFRITSPLMNQPGPDESGNPSVRVHAFNAWGVRVPLTRTNNVAQMQLCARLYTPGEGSSKWYYTASQDNCISTSQADTPFGVPIDSVTFITDTPPLPASARLPELFIPLQSVDIAVGSGVWIGLKAKDSSFSTQHLAVFVEDSGAPTPHKFANAVASAASADDWEYTWSQQSGASMGLVGCLVTCDDGIKNGDESDVDCGGSDSSVATGHCPRCESGRVCNFGTDCLSGECSLGSCSEDVVGPAFETSPTVNDVGLTSIELSASINEDGYVAVLAVPTSTSTGSPSVSQILDANDEGSQEVGGGQVAVTTACSANDDCDIVVPGLQEATEYELWGAAEDIVGNQGTEVADIGVHTTDTPPDTTPPSFGPDPEITDVHSTSVDLAVGVSEEATVAVLAIPHVGNEGVVPTASEVILSNTPEEVILAAGQQAGGAGCPAGPGCELTVTSLAAETQYHVWVAAADASDNPSVEPFDAGVITTLEPQDTTPATFLGPPTVYAANSTAFFLQAVLDEDAEVIVFAEPTPTSGEPPSVQTLLDSIEAPPVLPVDARAHVEYCLRRVQCAVVLSHLQEGTEYHVWLVTRDNAGNAPSTVTDLDVHTTHSAPTDQSGSNDGSVGSAGSNDGEGDAGSDDGEAGGDNSDSAGSADGEADAGNDGEDSSASDDGETSASDDGGASNAGGDDGEADGSDDGEGAAGSGDSDGSDRSDDGESTAASNDDESPAGSESNEGDDDEGDDGEGTADRDDSEGAAGGGGSDGSDGSNDGKSTAGGDDGEGNAGSDEGESDAGSSDGEGNTHSDDGEDTAGGDDGERNNDAGSDAGGDDADGEEASGSADSSGGDGAQSEIDDDSGIGSGSADPTSDSGDGEHLESTGEGDASSDDHFSSASGSGITDSDRVDGEGIVGDLWIQALGLSDVPSGVDGDYMVRLEMKLLLDYYARFDDGMSERGVLEQQFSLDIADALNVSTSRLQWVSARPGSVMVSVDILPAVRPSAVYLSLQLQSLFELAAAEQTIARERLDGRYLKHADYSYLVVTVIEPCEDGSFDRYSPRAACIADEERISGIALYTVLGIVGLFVLTALVSKCCCRRQQTHVFDWMRVCIVIVDFGTDVLLVRSYAVAGYYDPMFLAASALFVSICINGLVLYFQHMRPHLRAGGSLHDPEYIRFKDSHGIFYAFAGVLALSNVGVLRVLTTNVLGLKQFSLKPTRGRRAFVNHLKRIGFWSSMVEDVPQFAVQIWVAFFWVGGPTPVVWLSFGITSFSLAYTTVGALIATLDYTVDDDGSPQQETELASRKAWTGADSSLGAKKGSTGSNGSFGGFHGFKSLRGKPRDAPLDDATPVLAGNGDLVMDDVSDAGSLSPDLEDPAPLPQMLHTMNASENSIASADSTSSLGTVTVPGDRTVNGARRNRRRRRSGRQKTSAVRSAEGIAAPANRTSEGAKVEAVLPHRGESSEVPPPALPPAYRSEASYVTHAGSVTSDATATAL